MLVRVLGSIAARAGPEDDWVGLRGQQRAVLALLVADLGMPCRTDRLVEALWGKEAPPQAARLVQTVVSRLRRVLEPDDGRGSRLRSVTHGWVLHIDPELVDAARFERLAGDGADLDDEGQASAARERLEEAVALWWGRPFGELADHACLAEATVRLEERYLAARERLLRLRLRAGEAEAVAADAHQLVVAYPLRECLWAVLMQAQCRAGRPADALASYQQLREHLATELGTEPSGELQQLHAMVLRQDVPDTPGPPTEAPGPPGPQGGRVAGRWPCRRELPLTGRDEALAVLEKALSHAR